MGVEARAVRETPLETLILLEVLLNMAVGVVALGVQVDKQPHKEMLKVGEVQSMVLEEEAQGEEGQMETLLAVDYGVLMWQELPLLVLLVLAVATVVVTVVVRKVETDTEEHLGVVVQGLVLMQ